MAAVEASRIPPPVAKKPQLSPVSPAQRANGEDHPICPADEPTIQQTRIDVIVRDKKSYDFLCRATELRNWTAEFLDDPSIPLPEDLAAHALRNGVILARIANKFAPDIAPLSSIFDLDQELYNRRVAEYPDEPISWCVFKHNENINMWKKALATLNLNPVIFPGSDDARNGKIVPVIFCLYTMASLLYRMRRGPPLRNVAGTIKFSEDQLLKVADTVSDLPEFSNISKFLETRNTVDDEKTAAAIAQIEAAVRTKDFDSLLPSLQNTDAQLLYVEPLLVESYAAQLEQKDEPFIHKIVQDTISATNHQCGLNQLNDLLNKTENYSEDDLKNLLMILMWLHFENINESSLSMIMKLLREKPLPVTHDDVSQVLKEVSAIQDVKLAVNHGSFGNAIEALNNPVLGLEIKPENHHLYYDRLKEEYAGKDDQFYVLLHDLREIVGSLNGMTPEQKEFIKLQEAFNKDDDETIKEVLLLMFPQYTHDDVFPLIFDKVCTQRSFNSIDDVEILLKKINVEWNQAAKEAEKILDFNDALASEDRQTAIKLFSELPEDYHVETINEKIEIYVECFIEVIRTLKKKQPESQKETFYWQPFPYGTVSVETQNRKKYWGEVNPKADHILERSQIKELIYNENKRDEAEKRNAAATKIQHGYKNWKQKKDHDLLYTLEAPPLALVRQFLPSSEKQANDMAEISDIATQKLYVTQMVVANGQIAAQLEELDQKIGLIVQNRITNTAKAQKYAEEAEATKKKIHEKTDHFQLRHPTVRKKEKDAHNRLAELFYLLQVKPQYLADLINALQPEKIAVFFSKITAPVFGHLTEHREQFLALGFLGELIRRAVFNSTAPDQIMATPTMQIVMAAMTNKAFAIILEDTFNEENIEPTIKEFIASCEQDSHPFSLFPDDIFEKIYFQKPADISAAVECPKVQEILENSKEFVGSWALKLSKALAQCFTLNRPLRYLCLSLQNSFRQRFRNSSPKFWNKVICQFICEAAMAPQILTLQLVKETLSGEASKIAKSKIEVLVEFLIFSASAKGYSNAHWYLSSLNKEINLIHDELIEMLTVQLGSDTVDTVFAINHFTQYDPAHKPTLTILAPELKRIVEYVQKHFKKTNDEQNFAKLLKSVKVPSDTADDKVILLHLLPPRDETNKATEAETMDLFISVKRHLIELMLSDIPGDTISELLNAEPTAQHEELHSSRFPDSPDIHELQRWTTHNLKELENAGIVTSKENYQELVTDIANDIRQANHRAQERAEQKKVLQDTKKRLESQRQELETTLASYESYLDSCVENMGKSSKRASIQLAPEKSEKILKSQNSVNIKNLTYKAKGDKLFRKNVLITIDGYEHWLSKTSFVFKGTEKNNILNVVVTDGKDLSLEGELNTQDVLAAVYEDDKEIRFMNVVVFRTNALLDLLNRKFYAK